MAGPTDDKLEGGAQTKERLDRVRPTVVVRRRVYEPSPASTRKVIHAGAINVDDTGEDEDDSGPPSSVNVARALSSLRAHEMKRLDALMSADDTREDQARAAAGAPRSVRSAALAPAPPSVRVAGSPNAPMTPTVRVGSSIAIGDLARQLETPTQELVTALVMRGFFSVTIKSSLPRETARTAATMFGWQVEEVEDEEPAPKKTKASAKTASAKTASAKASSKASSKGAPAPPGRATAKAPATKNTRPRSR